MVAGGIVNAASDDDGCQLLDGKSTFFNPEDDIVYLDFLIYRIGRQVMMSIVVCVLTAPCRITGKGGENANSTS